MARERSDGQKRRDALLDAALSCFTERGVLATGIEDIRRAAGASPSSVYHLFDGIEDVTTKLLERIFARLFAHLAVRIAKTKTAEEAVTTLVDAHLEWILRHRDEGRFMYQAMALELAPGSQASLAAKKAELLAPVVAHLRTFIDAGTLPRWSPLVFDVVLLGASHEACRRFLAGAPLKAAWMRRELPRLAWKTVRGSLSERA